MQALIRAMEITCRQMEGIRNKILAGVSQLLDTRPDMQAAARNLRMAASHLRITKMLLDRVCPLLRQLLAERDNLEMVENACRLLGPAGKKAQCAGFLLKAAGRQMHAEGGGLQARGWRLRAMGDFVQRTGIGMQQEAMHFIKRRRW